MIWDNSRVNPRRWNLLAVGALAAAAVAIAFAGLNRPGPLVVFGVLLALVLPGYGLSVVLLPELGRVERALCALGLSLAIDVLSGFILNLTPFGLSAASWAGWLGSLTLVFVAVAWRRASQAIGTPLVWPQVSFGSKLVFAGALLTMLLAVKIAQLDSGGPGSTFTQLWALPRHTSDGDRLQIGVRNGESTIERYGLVVEMNGARLNEWQDVELGSEQEWTSQIGLPNDSVGMLRVRLYRAAEPDEAYRTVQVWLGEIPTGPANSTPAANEMSTAAAGFAPETPATAGTAQ
jgi:uncharacterized membrane protein